MLQCVSSHLRRAPVQDSSLLSGPASHAMLGSLGRRAAQRWNPRIVLRAWSGQAAAPQGSPLVPGEGLAQQQQQQQQAGGLSPAGIPVEPPPVAQWSADCVNSVTLIGTVRTEPQLRTTAANQVVASVLMGLRPRFGRGSGSQSVTLEAWGYPSLQMAQYIRPGMQIQVEGHLRENVWTDKATNTERRKLKVIVDRLQVIPEREGAASDVPGAAAEPLAAAAAAPARERSSSGSRSATPPGGLPPSAREAHRLFQEEVLSLHQVAQRRGAKISTVVDYVIRAAGEGMPLDWARAASELQLGPRGSPWLTGDEVWAAVAVTVAEQFPGEDPEARLMDIRLTRARELLEQGEGTWRKLSAQESLAGGKWVSYGQIKLVTIMRRQGVDWNEVVIDAPVELPAAVAAVPPPPPF